MIIDSSFFFLPPFSPLPLVMVSVKGFLNDISERVFVEPLITASYIPLSHR